MNASRRNFATLHEAEEAFNALGSDEKGSKIMAAKAVFACIEIDDIGAAAANVVKQEMLAAGGDCAVPWEMSVDFSARGSILIMGTVAQMRKALLDLEHTGKYPKLAECATAAKAIREELAKI